MSFLEGRAVRQGTNYIFQTLETTNVNIDERDCEKKRKEKESLIDYAFHSFLDI